MGGWGGREEGREGGSVYVCTTDPLVLTLTAEEHPASWWGQPVLHVDKQGLGVREGKNC